MKTPLGCRAEIRNSVMRCCIPAVLLLTSLSQAGAAGFSVYAGAPDTLVATATGGTRPPIDPNGDPVINGDFTITRSGGDDRVGDGIDDRTEWRLTFNGAGYDTTYQVLSALLTMRLEPKDQNAANDNIEIDDCDCPEMEVGVHPLHQIYEISFEMLDYGYQSRLFIDSLRLNGGFIMRYQDDAIVSFAEVRLVVVPELVVTSPESGELWPVDEQHTIRWTGPNINGWNIYFSSDDGFSYTQFDTILPPNDTTLVWRIPDSLETSSISRIKVVDVLDSRITGVSAPFTTRGYDLVRAKSDGTLEVYKPSRHGWSIANDESNLWPQVWYQQFDYRMGTDPFTGEMYRFDFASITAAQSSDFPDWPSFVETFGVDKCYHTTLIGGNPSRPKQRAMEAWSALKSSWSGSCFGFPSSALLAFEESTSFFTQNPLLPSTETIFDLTSIIPLRKTINKYFLYQNDTTTIAHLVNNLVAVDPREVLTDVREMLLDDAGPHRVLALNGPNSGAHAVIVHKLVRDPVTEGQFRLYVYDANTPGENREFILLDSLGNTWEEFLDLGYGPAEDGLFLDLLIDHYLQRQSWNFLKSPLRLLLRRERMRLVQQ